MNKIRKGVVGLFSRFGQFLRQSRALSLLMLLLVFAVCVFLLKWMPKNELPPLNAGDPVLDNIVARIPFRGKDMELLLKRQNDVERTSPRYYRIDKARVDEMGSRYDAMMDEVVRRRLAENIGSGYVPSPDTNKSVAEFVEKMQPYLYSILSGIAMDESRRNKANKLVSAVVGGGILDESNQDEGQLGKNIMVEDLEKRDIPYNYNEIPTPERAARKTVDALLTLLTEEQRINLATDKLRDFFQALYQGGNLLYDSARTETLKAERMEKATSEIVEKLYPEGSILIAGGRDKKLSEADFELYKIYSKEYSNHLLKQRTWRSVPLLQKIALVGLLIALSCIFMLRVQPELLGNNRAVWLIGFIEIMALLVNYGVIELCTEWILEGRLKTLFPLYMAMPLAVPALVISSIYDGRSAIFAGMFVAGVSAVALDLSFPTFAVGLFVSAAGTASVRYAYDYKKFVVRAFGSCFITVLISFIVFQQDPDFVVMLRDHRLKSLLVFLIVPVANGLLTAMLASGLIITMETLLDVTCRMTYLSLTDRNHPLLKKLQLEAPGTYHHCERVALLAEEAANCIGAMSQKVQAYALFHDVGKLASPEMFTENSNGRDMFRGKTPAASAAIIRNHVEYGVQLAKKYNLKTPLRRAIECHHGNDFISFFYEKEKERTGRKRPPEAPFRYPGPLPEEKEAVILMMADCCEAAVCSLTEPTEQNVREMVEKIFIGKIQRRQLDAARITADELFKVRESFLKTFKSMNHTRISYSRNEEKKT